MTNGVNAVAIHEKDNAQYDCDEVTSGTVDAMRTALNTASNWDRDNSRHHIDVPTGCDFDLTDCGGVTCDPPMAVCNMANVTLDLADGNTILPSQIDAGSTADCGLYAMTVSPNSFNCSQVGTTIPVTLTVTDVNSDASTCVGGVEIIGLPCGYTLTDVNCDGEISASYAAQTGTFYLETDCYETIYYRPTDSQGFIQATLCGNGEIIAQVTEVVGSGFAGIAMREGTGPSDKLLELGIDGVSLTRRSLRQVTGGTAYNHLFSTQGKNWLRLTRTGNVFGAYQSLDGVNWQPVLVTTIPMSSCIDIGMFATSTVPGNFVTGVFNNVSIMGVGPALQAPTTGLDIAATPNQEITLFPNPATDELNVNLQQFVGESITIGIFNVNGQLVKNLEIDEVYEGVQSINVNTLENGTYLMQIRSPESIVSKKFIIAGK